MLCIPISNSLPVNFKSISPENFEKMPPWHKCPWWKKCQPKCLEFEKKWEVIRLHKNNKRQAIRPGQNNRMGSKEIIPFPKKLCSTFDCNSDAWAKLLLLSDQWFLWTWRPRHLSKTLKTCQNWDPFTCCILRGVRISSPLSIMDLWVNASVSCVESNPSNSADLPRAGKRERKIQICP